MRKPTAHAVAVLLLIAAGASSQVPHDGTVVRPAEAGRGPVVVPDRFLRSWDPVTFFFDRAVGDARGRPEDAPGSLVKISPAHPGAFTWIDERTLQFRPADPWSPLERYEFAVAGETTTLTTLMAAPLRTIPAADTTGLDPVEAVTLVFPEPIDPADLARMVTVELRPLPGVGTGRARWLTSADFDIKVMERSSRADDATYVLDLTAPIAAGTRAVVHLRLSLDDGAERSFVEIPFATAEPFRVVAVGSRRTRYPVTPDGTQYTPDQALDCGSDSRTVVVELSAPPAALDPVRARNLVRFTPAVSNLEFRTAGRTLEVTGDFRWETLYRVTVVPTDVRDAHGRPLAMRAPSEVHLFFPRRPAYLRWQAAAGVVERLGPQEVPVDGRGHQRFDLRIHPVDPLDRSFWPFPDRPVTVDESERPPGPGEAPPPHSEPRFISEHELRTQLAALGSPAVSALVDVPLERDGSAATFGLDLAPHLERVAGPRAPGHYLVGLRALDAGTSRQWMRIQVTDLCLTTVEEPHAVRFVVTSLATGTPVAGAEVRVEGSRHGSWHTFVTGTTDPDGVLSWAPRECPGCSVLRLVVSRGDDLLVLDATDPPDVFADDSWSESYDTWLQWTTGSTRWRGPQPEAVSHVFTERPVYRPEEPVHIKGYVRWRSEGRLELLELGSPTLVVAGPGDLVWREPVTLTEAGSFYHRFSADDRPTGTYRTWLEGVLGDGEFSSRAASFQVEAYRLPRFEVDLHAEERVSLDREFRVALTATYYAGGRVADQPVHWRVTQFPYTWQPAEREGFVFSSDGRYSRTERFETTAALDRTDQTDAEGGAVLVLNPTVEPTAQPRTYVVEATVTGADDQTVTSSERIVALPAFVLGLRAPRYLERATTLEPEVLVLGGDGEPVVGQEVTVRLLHRQWHSYLRASDFSDGEARYVTDVVDEDVREVTVLSAAEPLAVQLDLPAAGVYVVELEARDEVGRAQVVAVDLYAGGDEAVAWSKPATRLLSVTPDADRYEPGETANLVLQSPFQEGRALVVVEAPEGNRYQWLLVEGGKAAFSLPVEAHWAPALPVHFILMRGRVPGTEPVPGSTTDLGKPATLAATTWLAVNPRGNQVSVELEHPERALPGQEIEVTVRLADPDGRPLAGEVTLWLVDQAVLALGQEQRLDPLPDLITAVASHLEVRDTRDLPFGDLPFAVNPGGGAAELEQGILDRATVRRNFQPVPFYDPRILVSADGTVTVTVALPDNLTNFKLRAKAVCGAERFGWATGHLAVRLPLIVQPALPRFVRPGDLFAAAAIGRVVEGEGGPGAAELEVDGLTVDGPTHREVVWVPDRPERLEFPVQVPTPEYTDAGELARTEVALTVGVERASDGATDAFQVTLPIRDDRRRVTDRLLADLVPSEPAALPPVAGEARPGTVRRTVLVSNQPALVRMAAGLSFLAQYPYGCTEQKLSRARAHIALERFRDVLHLDDDGGDLERAVDDVLAWLPSVVDDHGLVGYWPGSRGYVSLTAWVVEFMVEARAAGLGVDESLYEELLVTLERALRSDYSRFIDGESFAERCWALRALARAGRLDEAYAAELARRAQFLDLEATANVLYAFGLADAGTSAAAAELEERLWHGVVIRLWQGRETYGGLQTGSLDRNGLILPSETRTLAGVTRALAEEAPGEPRLQVLVNGLVTLGRDDGWGSTNANAAALLALTEVLSAPAPGLPERLVELRWAGQEADVVSLTSERPLVHRVATLTSDGEVVLASDEPGPLVVVRATTSWIPAPPGSMVATESAGFVVTRELLLYGAPDAPPRRTALDEPGLELDFTVGDVIEDHVQVVNPHDRNYVAVVVPLAAGMEPLNPSLATAPPEARPAGRLTRAPTYAAFLDDQVAFYFDDLPKGTYDVYFRVRATVPGRYVQPAASAEMMYDGAVRGNGCGAVVRVVPAAE